MQRVVSVEEMKQIDRFAISGDLEKGYYYMKKAGKGLAVEIMKKFSVDKKVLFVCGKGNNGGDGFVAAEFLRREGFVVCCFLLTGKKSVSGEAKLALDDYSGGLREIYSSEELLDVADYDVVVDCIFGVGLTGSPRGIYGKAVSLINKLAKYVIAADVPSGLGSGDEEHVVNADMTVTMGFVKNIMLSFPQRKFVGEIVTVPLGHPEDIVTENFSGTYLATFEDAVLNMPKRIADGSKIDHGQLLSVAGSRGMLGALELLSLSALRSGCGMVHCAVAYSLVDVFSSKVTEPVIYSVEDSGKGTLSESSYDKILQLSKRCNVAVIGPGLSSSDESGRLVRKLVSKLTIPIVLDADGINAFRSRRNELSAHGSDIVITPHMGELRRLFGEIPSEFEALNDFLINKSKEFDITILLKGNPTRVAEPSGRITFYIWGTSALATAGSGDVLSGIIASFIAQGKSVSEAIIPALYVHAISGKSSAKIMGEYSVIASDIVNSIHLGIKSLTNNRSML